MKGMQPAECNKFYIGIYQYLSEIYISLSFHWRCIGKIIKLQFQKWNVQLRAFPVHENCYIYKDFYPLRENY